MTKIKYVPMDDLWLYLMAISDDANKSNIRWTTIGGVGVFGHLVKAYGFDDAKKIFEYYDRKTDDIDIITKQYEMIDIVKNLFKEEVRKSLSLKDKYTIKKKDGGIHIDIYTPNKYDGKLKFNDNLIRTEIFDESVKADEHPDIYIAPIRDLIDLKLRVYTGRNRGKEKSFSLNYFKRMGRKKRKGKIKHNETTPVKRIK